MSNRERFWLILILFKKVIHSKTASRTYLEDKCKVLQCGHKKSFIGFSSLDLSLSLKNHGIPNSINNFSRSHCSKRNHAFCKFWMCRNSNLYNYYKQSFQNKLLFLYLFKLHSSFPFTLFLYCHSKLPADMF